MKSKILIQDPDTRIIYTNDKLIIDRDGDRMEIQKENIPSILERLKANIAEEIIENIPIWKKTCKICGETFYTGSANQKTCSKECQEENHRNLIRKKQQARKSLVTERKKKKERAGKPCLKETVEAAKERGMTYGKYKAEKYLASIPKIEV